MHRETAQELEVIQDRLRVGAEDQAARLNEALEAALRAGHGRLIVHALDAAERECGSWRYSSDLHCAECDLHYQDALPSLFSFNSPIGACEKCRGFGRVIGIDYALVIPDAGKTLGEGAIRPWQTPSFKECQDDLVRHARRRGVALDVPWRELPAADREWVMAGEGPWTRKTWYGLRRFFAWLETKAYKMHIRVLLSKYRSYTLCPACHGARLKPDALLWRLGLEGDGSRRHDPRTRLHAGHRLPRVSAGAAAFRRRSMRPPSWCSASCACASSSCATSAWAT